MEEILRSIEGQSKPKPRSILKKTSQQPAYPVPANVNIAPPTSDQAARHLQTALSYAHEIQAQKALQVKILEHIEELSLIPESGTVTGADAKAFKAAVVLFQPSDYSALLEERNVNGFCGYTLCGEAPLPAKKGRYWKHKGEPERLFCSVECARKAMYVRAQLDEVPAWERRGGVQTEILLKDEVQSKTDEAQPPPRMVVPQIQQHDQLARERGETANSLKVQLVTDQVVEKQVRSPLQMSKTGVKFDDLAHDSIEGYSITNDRFKNIKADSEDD